MSPSPTPPRRRLCDWGQADLAPAPRIARLFDQPIEAIFQDALDPPP